jgi:hypothetical protein
VTGDYLQSLHAAQAHRLGVPKLSDERAERGRPARPRGRGALPGGGAARPRPGRRARARAPDPEDAPACRGPRRRFARAHARRGEGVLRAHARPLAEGRARPPRARVRDAAGDGRGLLDAVRAADALTRRRAARGRGVRAVARRTREPRRLRGQLRGPLRRCGLRAAAGLVERACRVSLRLASRQGDGAHARRSRGVRRRLRPGAPRVRGRPPPRGDRPLPRAGVPALPRGRRRYAADDYSPTERLALRATPSTED